jgi:steroid delta-isomerase-like uncharacterized protein
MERAVRRSLVSSVAFVLVVVALLANPVGRSVAQRATPAADGTEANKDIVRRFYEIFARGDFAALGEIVAPDVVDHHPVPGQAPGAEGVAQNLAPFKTGFLDGAQTIDALVAEGDLVVDRVTLRGTHTGDFLGIPATGKAVIVSALEMRRIAGGLIVEVWPMFDQLGLLIRFGVVQPPGGQAPPTAAT